MSCDLRRAGGAQLSIADPRDIINARYSIIGLALIIVCGRQASTIYIYESLETSECFGHYIYLVTFLKSR